MSPGVIPAFCVVFALWFADFCLRRQEAQNSQRGTPNSERDLP